MEALAQNPCAADSGMDEKKHPWPFLEEAAFSFQNVQLEAFCFSTTLAEMEVVWHRWGGLAGLGRLSCFSSQDNYIYIFISVFAGHCVGPSTARGERLVGRQPVIAAFCLLAMI